LDLASLVVASEAVLCWSCGKLMDFKIDLASQGNIYDDGRLAIISTPTGAITL